jgi:ABC-type glycerol-3-phosphate transport system permease component
MIIPEFLAVRNLGLSGRPALILPYIAIGIALPTLVMTTFFRLVPRELYDSARVDGASLWQIFSRIYVPVSRPAIATCAILLFLIYWNEFPLALALIQDPAQFTLPVALASTTSRSGTPYNLIAAVLVLATIPVLAAFALSQRHLVDGLLKGGIKG